MLAFSEGLRQAGWTDGQNVVIELHDTSLSEEALSTIAAALVQRPPDVLFIDNTAVAAALKQATNTVPIVVIIGDPVSTGLVANLAHPGGNITGLSSSPSEHFSKRVELLKEVVPTMRQLGLLYGDAATPSLAPAQAVMTAAASQLAVHVAPVVARRPEEFDLAFETLNRAHADALLVANDGVTMNYQSEIAAFATPQIADDVHPFPTTRNMAV
jgi:putative ABC transport system substrate-binding protein